MSVLDLFIIFFVLISLWPLVQQRMLEAARVKMLKSIENKRGTRVITLIHRQEILALLGFPLARYIDIHDSEQILRAIKLTDPKVPIDLILHTPGGLVLATEQIAAALCKHQGKVTVFVPHYAMSGVALVLATEQIAAALCKHQGKVTVFVPHYAMSGGTLLALAADEIVMDENAVLGPVDPQLGQWPANSILKAVEQKPVSEVDDQTLIMADVARKAVGQIHALIINILRNKQNPPTPEKAEALADLLSSGVWTHDYPISVDQAREMGLNVRTDVPQEVYQLMNLFPQAGRGRPSVLYMPMPYPTRPHDERSKQDVGRR